MDKSIVIKNVVNLANDEYRRGDISIYQLFLDSGYLTLHEEISIDDIKAELRDCPYLVESWFNWSDDQRISSGWYIRKESENTYIIDRVESDSITTFTDDIDACAHFVKLQIEVMMNMRKKELEE